MELVWYFLFYSAVGFLLEVVFTRVTGGTKKDRKCMLFLPLCPVYGVGAVGILLLPAEMQARPLLLFPAAALAATGAEYLLSWSYEKAWGVFFWDYRHLPGHVNGRVSLPFTLAWGLLAVVLVYFVQPAVEQLTAMMPEDIIAAFGAMFLLDWFFTGQVLRRSHSTQSLRWWVRSIPAGEALSGSAPLSLRASGQRQSPDSPSIP